MRLIKKIRGFAVIRKFTKIRKELRRSRKLIEQLGGEVLVYDSRMNLARERLHWKLSLLYRNADERTLDLALIHFCAMASHMARGVPALGVGPKMKEGPHRWYLMVLRNLVDKYNSQYGTQLSAHQIEESSSLVPCVLEYHDLHQRAVESSFPSAWFGIQYEIDRLSFSEGPIFISHYIRKFGVGIVNCFGLLKPYLIEDIGHSRRNVMTMDELLEGNEEQLDLFVKFANEVLSIYYRFCAEAFRRAGAHRDTPKAKGNSAETAA